MTSAGRTTPKEIRSMSVVGAGLMGRGIALAAAKCGIDVAISDSNSDALARSIAELGATLNTLRTHSESGTAPGAVRAAESDVDLASADLVIEAVVESLAVKKQIFARLEPLASSETIFASNTSSLRIEQIAGCFARPARFCGLHFCHPVAERGLVEVVRGGSTNQATIDAAVAFVHKIAKQPIVAADAPGFVVNRLLMPYLNEAVELLCCGVDAKAIESAAMDFGMPWGPLTQLDSIGIDVAVRAGAILCKAFPTRVLPSALLVELYRACRLGEKTGAGFFSYENGGRSADLAPDVLPFILEHQSPAREADTIPSGAEAIARRLFLPMLVEAVRVVEEGIVADPRDVDTALVHGLAFSNAGGGILAWADRVGPAQVVEWLMPLAKLGERYRPPALLLAVAQTGGRLTARQHAPPRRRTA